MFFLIPVMIAQMFNPTTELVIPTGTKLIKQMQKLKPKE